MSLTQLANRIATTDGGVTSPYDSQTNAVKAIVLLTVGATSAPTDGPNNTYTKRVFRSAGPEVAIWDCLSPALSTNHTITVHGAAAVLIAEFVTCAGSVAVEQTPTPYDISGTTAGLAFADFTPGQNNCLVIGGHGCVSAGQPASYVGLNGFTALGSQIYNGGTNFGAGMVSQVQTTAAAVLAATNYASWGGSSTGVKIAMVYKEVAAASITLNDVVNGFGIQRVSGAGSIVITGSASATTGIEARIVLHGTSTEVVTWTSIKGAHTGGGFIGSPLSVPEGGWYNMQVRLASDHSVVANGSNRFGVGAFIGIGGQSLAARMSTDGTSVTPDARLAEYSGSAGTGWALRTNTGTAANALGNAIIAALGGNIPVWILNYGIGSTALIQAADSGSGYWLNTAGGSPYALFKAGVLSAGGKLEAFYWAQGEQDGYSNLVSEATYAAGLSTLFARIRSDLGQAALPIIVSPLGRYTNPGPTDASWEGIRRAQITAGTSANNVLAAFNQDLSLVDYVHLDDASAVKQGVRGARAYKLAMGLSSYARGPQISSAVKTAPTTVEVVLSHRGGSDFTPASGITGFSITGGAAPAITAAVRTNATKITLTLGSALTGGESLRYQYGANPTVSSAVHDDTSEALTLGLESGQSISITVPDTTAPTLTAQTASATGTTTASWSVNTDEGNGTLYYYASINATETAATIKASGQTQNITSSGTKTGSVSSLTPATGYYLHFVHRDAAGNDSTAVHTVQFTTFALPRATVPLFDEDGVTPVPDHTGVTWAWYDSYPPNFAAGPVVHGTVNITGGQIDVSLVGTSLAIGQIGALLYANGDGTPFSASNWGNFIPWAVNA